MNTYAKIREPEMGSIPALDRRKHSRWINPSKIPNHVMYMRITQPDNLDDAEFNTIIQEPFQFKGWKVRSIHLEFLTEAELNKELEVTK